LKNYKGFLVNYIYNWIPFNKVIFSILGSFFSFFIYMDNIGLFF